MILDDLTDELLRLKAQLQPHDVEVVLGGGMGLFLRDSYLSGARSPRYPVRPVSRSTNDLDLFLTADLIVDEAKVAILRDTIAALGFRSCDNARYFQFERPIGAQPAHRLKIDILSAPPADTSLVKRKGNRVRPHALEGIHGYLTPEAEGIALGLVPIDLGERARAHGLDDGTVCIPSSFNYLILKLHAFYDRRTREDSDFGRHHAYDIFRIVTDMRAEDWESAAAHRQQHAGRDYLTRAAEYCRAHFATPTSEGFLRLRENLGYIERRDEFDTYLADVVSDLGDLFA